MSFYSEIAKGICTSNGRCVLLLGPELSVNRAGLYYKSFFKQLAEVNKNSISQYFENENIFMFNNNLIRDSTVREISDFYANVGDKTLLELIARVKFPLIINTAPDKALNKVFESKYKMKEKGDYFYNYRDNETVRNQHRIKSIDEIPYPKKDYPVIYNIFGDYEDLNSIIFDHQTFYGTIQHLMDNDAIPPTIDEFLSKASSFLFLGFNFESWHYQLMCHKLGLGQPATVKNGYSSLKMVEQNSSVQIVLRNHFKVASNEDTPTRTIENLIEKLEETCPESLRKSIDNNNYEVYISYSWDDNHTDIITVLSDVLQNKLLPDTDKNFRIIDLINKSGKLIAPGSDIVKLFSNSTNISRDVNIWYDTLRTEGVDESGNVRYSREKVIDLLKLKLAGHGIKVLRDKNEVTFGDSIDSFMDRIGKGKAVIRVVSDKYLKSRYCLDEALRIKKHSFRGSRVFTIVLADSMPLKQFVNQLGDTNNIAYKIYWQLVIENIYSKIDQLKMDLAEKERLKRFYSIYIDIYEYIIEFIQSVQDSVRMDIEQKTYSNISLPAVDTFTPQNEEMLNNFVTTVANILKQ